MSVQHHTIFGLERDRLFMQQAIKQAQQAFVRDEVPIGCVIVDPAGRIIGKGSNAVERLHSQTEHAECRAIGKAGKALNDWRLEGCWLYVTLEPCAMCMNLIMLSRLAGVVFAVHSPLFGFHLDNALSVELYKKGTLAVIDGVCKEEARDMLKQFFKKKRN